MRLEQKATFISSFTAAVLVIMKMVVGVMSGSVAVLASAIDSFLDFSVSIFNYFALNQSGKAPDEQFNFGRSKLEPIAAVIEGTIISLSGAFIFYEAMLKIMHHRPTEYLNESIGVMLVSIVVTAILVAFLHHVAKKTNNMVIRADALHYKTDLFTNAAILIALLVIAYTDYGLIDPILGFLIAIYMVYSAFPIIKEGTLMLMDISLDEEDVEKIRELINNDPNVTDYHYLQTRQSGPDKFISVHLVFNVSITLYDAHHISDQIEAGIKKLFGEDRTHVIIHMDPYDDSIVNDEEH
jgi:cation diffusion facilitator family transporter